MSYQAERIESMISLSPIKEIEDTIKLFERKYWLQLHSTKKNEELVLYHYTTVEGLKGILGNRAFWCTEINYLNDTLELKYGRNIIIDRLNSFVKDENNEQIKKLLNKLIIVSGTFATYNTFVSCFSENDNLLNQWNYYASNGKGYNLGIHFNSDFVPRTQAALCINELSSIHYPKLRKVFYDVDKQYEIINTYIDYIISGAKKALSRNNGIEKDWDSHASLQITNVLLEIMFSLKSPNYKDEQEWRLVFMMPKEMVNTKFLHFRTNSNLIVPYLNAYIYEHRDDKYFFPLRSINIGPMLSEEIGKKSLDIYIANMSDSFGNPINIVNDFKVNRSLL